MGVPFILNDSYFTMHIKNFEYQRSLLKPSNVTPQSQCNPESYYTQYLILPTFMQGIVAQLNKINSKVVTIKILLKK